MILGAVWDLLLRVKKLDLYAKSFEPRKPVWRGHAEGRVVLTRVNPGTLIFTETGEWNFSAQPRIKFFNVYRWRLADGEILELSHLRHGIDSPVHLLDFKAAAGGADDVGEGRCGKWRSEKPHVCREDLYAATLTADKDGSIRLDWTIDGPTKRQTVQCHYR